MRRLLNEHTGTVHKSSGGITNNEAVSEAVCGALQHVPRRHVTLVTNGEGRTDGENVERCGRCFEEAGGY